MKNLKNNLLNTLSFLFYSMSIGECRYYIEQHVAAQWDDGSYRNDLDLIFMDR